MVIAAARFQWRGASGALAGLAGAGAGRVSRRAAFLSALYFLLLPVVVLMAARGFALLGRRRELVALLLLLPADALRAGLPGGGARPRMARHGDGSRQPRGRRFVRNLAKPGDTSSVWGYRPEIFVYTDLPAATQYLDSQPLTGVPADRHLTQSEPVETEAAARRRAELTQSQPAFVLDGLGFFNPAPGHHQLSRTP